MTIISEECGGPAHKRFINPNNNANGAGFLQTITTTKYTGELYIPKPCPGQDICQAVPILVTWEEAVAVTTTPYTCQDNDTTPGCGPFVTNGPMPGKEALEGVGKLIFDLSKCVGSSASIGGCALEAAGIFPWGRGLKWGSKAVKVKYGDAVRNESRVRQADDQRLIEIANSPRAPDELIRASSSGTIIQGNQRIRELLQRVADGKIDPETEITVRRPGP